MVTHTDTHTQTNTQRELLYMIYWGNFGQLLLALHEMHFSSDTACLHFGMQLKRKLPLFPLLAQEEKRQRFREIPRGVVTYLVNNIIKLPPTL